MSATSAALSAPKPKALLAIFVGGIVAGSLDLCAAFISYGAGVPRAIAAGLLGRTALHGGTGPYVLGIALQFFIATSAAAVYYAASRKLAFLKENVVVCGLFYGIAVFLVMNLIVVPLSALHGRGPFQLWGLIQGLLVHMILIGLPISFSVRKFAR
jgi:Na+/alanine symporter